MLAGVALGLPALARAEKLQRRAARVGFDWPDAAGPRAKVDEELAEIVAAPPERIAEEVGDLPPSFGAQDVRATATRTSWSARAGRMLTSSMQYVRYAPRVPG